MNRHQHGKAGIKQPGATVGGRPLLGATLAAVTGVAALATLMACGGSVRPPKYYALEIPGQSAQAANPIPADLLVGRVAAPALLRDNRIVYRTGSTQLGVYDYHRWAEFPSAMLEAIILRKLRGSGEFRSVQAYKSSQQGDLVVRGRLHDLSEISGSGLAARLTLELELFDLKDGKVLFSTYYSKDEPANGREVGDVVEAMNRNVNSALAEFQSKLVTYLRQHPPKSE